MRERGTAERERVEAFCRRNHVRRLSLFGSVPRPDFSEDSDIDVLVELEEGQTPGFFGIARMRDTPTRNGQLPRPKRIR